MTLDIDDTCDVVHGHQQLSLFNAHYDERCFLPIHVYDTDRSRPVAVVLRPGKTPSGVEVRGHLRRLVRRIRTRWPSTRILLRGDSHYARPEAMEWCEANGIDFVFGLAGSRPSVGEGRGGSRTRCGLSTPSPARRSCAATPRPATRRGPGPSSAAPSPVSRPRRSASTSASSSPACASARLSGSTTACTAREGQSENLIKLHKTQLASDRTSCRSALANQMRLVLHTAAYWLMLTVRDAIPRPRDLATAEFATLRLRLLKIAARVIETASRVRLAFAAACPEAELFRSLPSALWPSAP